MRKNLNIMLFIFMFVIVNSCFADEWNDYAGLDHAWDGQKTVTNK